MGVIRKKKLDKQEKKSLKMQGQLILSGNGAVLKDSVNFTIYGKIPFVLI